METTPIVNPAYLQPDYQDLASSFDRPRLGPDQVAEYRREGYTLYQKPVLRQRQFEGLKQRFEELLTVHESHGIRPEAMDVPHFGDHKLFEWIFSDEMLAMVEPLIGPDIALFSTHFLSKPAGNGKRVPWHEDSFYWKDLIEPMHVCTVWLAIDPSTEANGCMNVIPRALDGYSEYGEVDGEANVFKTEIKWLRNVTTDRVGEVREAPANVSLKAVRCELRPNQASLHDARLIHGSDANRSNMRRCGYTMRFIPASVRYIQTNDRWPHQIYLARGKGHPDNRYADPGKDYPDIFFQRYNSGNSH